MLVGQPKSIKVAYLYHQSDRSIFESLRKQLAGLCRNELIYELPEPLAGADIYQIKGWLEKAQVIILLISSDFDAQDDLTWKETQLIIKECAKNGAYIWPIIARYIHWDASSFREYEVFWGKEKSITYHTPQEDAFRKLIPKISQEITHMHSEAWLQDGDRYCHQMQLGEAHSAYKNSRHYTSSYLPALLGIGHLFRKWDKLEEAKQFFEKIVSYDPQIQQKEKDASYSGNQRADLTNACCKGYALLELERPNEALVAFQKVHQQNASPMNSMQRSFYAKAYCGEGDAYVKIGNQSSDFTIYYKALEAYNKAKDLFSDNPKYLNKIGDIYTILAAQSASNYSYEQALNTYLEINDNFTNDALAHVGRGNALKGLNRLMDALMAYEKALKLDQYEVGGHSGKGEILLALGKPQEALSAFEEALRLDKDNAHCYYSKGRTLAKLSRHQEALNAYNKARDCGFKSPSVLVHQAMSLLELAEVEQAWGLQGQVVCYYEKAQMYYSYALGRALSEKDIVLCGLGKIAFAYYGQWDQAFRYYQRAINFAPNKANGYFEIGKMFVEQGNHSEAFKYFEYARERCNHPTSMLDEADIETAYGDAYFRIAEKLDPKDRDNYLLLARNYYQKAVGTRGHTMAYVGLGKTYAKLHYSKEAINALNFAIKRNPKFAECYFIKGNCCYEQEQYEEAYYLYKNAIKLGFNNASVYNALGDTQLAMKRYIDALKDFDHVLENIKDEVAHAHCGRGTALYALERVEDALQSFEKANKLDQMIIHLNLKYRHTIQNIGAVIEGRVRANPENTSAYKHKGDVLLLLGERTDDAIDAYTKVIEHGVRSADVHCCRGEAYYRRNEYYRSLRDYRKALEIDPNYQPAQLGKAKAETMIKQLPASFIKKIHSLANSLLTTGASFWIT